MTHYIIRRLFLVMPMLLGISFITFVMINLAPGDPVTAMINPDELMTLNAAQIEMRRESLGLNQPVLVRYGIWLSELFQGNMGYSYQINNRPIAKMIVARLPATLFLTFSSLLLAMTTGVFLGVLSALRQYTFLDHFLTVSTFFGLSIPGFLVALVGVYLFSAKLRWLPAFGMWTPGAPTTLNLDLLTHAFLPVLSLAVLDIAGFMRYARTTMLDAMGSDYVVTARSKGLHKQTIIWRHVFRNALLPLITIAGLNLPGLLGGSFIIESIFTWPGLGLLGYQAVTMKDYPLQMGIALVLALCVLLANLFTDIAYAFVDPRIRYD